MKDEQEVPAHPFECDECGGRAPFRIKGCDVEHEAYCSRRGEDPERVFIAAVEWCKQTGRSIP